uniref:V-type proton ATPase proteolipid subunit n=1 Tax=Nothobranchius furzeri TaxID=105023 RepID=A0A1A8U040_NOTFU
MGASAAMVFSALGAAYGTAKSGTGIAAMSVMRPELIMKSIIPVVMAGIIAIYGLVVAVLIANNISDKITLYKSFLHLGAGLSVGLSGLAAGFAIGIVGDAGVREHWASPDLRLLTGAGGLCKQEEMHRRTTFGEKLCKKPICEFLRVENDTNE